MTLGVASAPSDVGELTFDALYDAHFDLVWRSLRRLGVPDSALDDALQDVFVVVHRQLTGFQGRSSPRTWLAGIAVRVAADHRRRLRRKGGWEELSPAVVDPGPGPQEQAARAEGIQLLDRLLRQLEDFKREVFVMVELEQMTAPEVAEALGLNLNTVYSRLRLARADFERALAAYRAGSK